MNLGQQPTKLTPGQWTALVDDTARLMDDLTLGFGPEHVTPLLARDLLKRLFEALEAAYDLIDELDPNIRRSREHADG